MGYIKQLPDDLIKKIAAGEVIERPSSVVKELVENSIDANSTKIEIETKRGGKYIKVSDNGNGIHADDTGLLFSRHATSKITGPDDLWGIKTLGFRGEALASISAISKVKCFSRNAACESGFEISVTEGNLIKKTHPISFGTIFEIEDLFYNVPARQKFLKSEATEISHIYDVVLSLALSHPNISFKLISNNEVSLSSGGSGNLTQTISELLGDDLKERLIFVSKKNHFCSLSSFVSTLEITRTNKKSQFIFINKRPVKCHIISKAVQSVFENLLVPSRFPVVVLSLDFKVGHVDVNVHPAKKEVRYTHPNDVYNFVLHSIQDAISDYYKKEYKEKTVHAFPEAVQQSNSVTTELDTLFTSHVTATRLEEPTKQPLDVTHYEIASSVLSKPPRNDSATSLFSVNNLKCRVVFSDKPVANMTKIGNKTIFEVGSIFDDNTQVVFSGEITGDASYQKDFFNSIFDLSKKIYESYINNKTPIQRELINEDPEAEVTKEKKRRKPPEKLLYKVWEKDNWTCVYCAKQLLDPKIVNDFISREGNTFKIYINKEGKEITTYSLREHTATYDHYLPVSKLPQFDFDLENLFACCLECNKRKSDSMELKTWKPNKKNSWDKPLYVASFCFEKPTL